MQKRQRQHHDAKDVEQQICQVFHDLDSSLEQMRHVTKMPRPGFVFAHRNEEKWRMDINFETFYICQP